MTVTATRGGGGGVPSTHTEKFFLQSVQMIDAVFGEGYAKKNPALITSLVRARCREEWEAGE